MTLEERVAYHEAAHAVATWALWRPFEYVTVIPQADSNGHLRFLPMPDINEQVFEGDHDVLLMDRAVITLAGYIADSVYADRVWPTLDDMWGRITPDDHHAVDLAYHHSSAVADCSNPERIEYEVAPPLQRMYERAEELVIDSWGAIEAVAQALLVEKTLTALQVAGIAHGAPSARPPILQHPGFDGPIYIPPPPKERI